jgi:hypothetical protein
MRSTPQGDAGRGGSLPGASPVVAGRRPQGGGGTPQGCGTRSPMPQPRLLVGAIGRMTVG